MFRLGPVRPNVMHAAPDLTGTGRDSKEILQSRQATWQ
jgi:hypothetical protein